MVGGRDGRRGHIYSFSPFFPLFALLFFKKNITNKDLSGLKAFQEDFPIAKSFVFYGGDREKNIDKIHLIPLQTVFLLIKDILKNINKGNKKIKLKEIANELPSVSILTHLDNLLRFFQSSQEHIALVKEGEAVVGLVTIEDLLEEIVGEIQDEHEKPRETLEKIDENKYLISGNLSIRDWSDTFGVEIEPMGVDTVGGLVIALLEHIPQKGDSVKYEDFVFTVEGVRKRRITSILQEMNVKSTSDEDEND
mgnify:CR=1 FL=1